MCRSATNTAAASRCARRSAVASSRPARRSAVASSRPARRSAAAASRSVRRLVADAQAPCTQERVHQLRPLYIISKAGSPSLEEEVERVGVSIEGEEPEVGRGRCGRGRRCKAGSKREPRSPGNSIRLLCSGAREYYGLPTQAYEACTQRMIHRRSTPGPYITCTRCTVAQHRGLGLITHGLRNMKVRVAAGLMLSPRGPQKRALADSFFS